MNKSSLIAFCFVLFSCSNPVPKPCAYYRIDLPEHQYEKFTGYSDFSFDLSTYSKVEPEIDPVKGEWFNIHYPAFNAKIHCSYFPIKQSQLNTFLEDNHKLVYRHAIKANDITQQTFSNPEKKIYGILYHLEGNVATPLQFVITDSLSHFFRASLLFNTVPNQDSIAPVLNYIEEDVKQLIESFEW